MPVVATTRELAAYAAGAARLPTGSPLAILGSPRSGTELFAELFGSHPRTRFDGELFTAPRRMPLEYVCGKAALARRRGVRSWSFKILCHQLRWFESRFGSAPEFLRRLQDRGFTFVVIERRNRLLQALSYLHAERTRYHFRAGDDSSRRFEPLELDPARVLASMYVLDQDAAWGREVLGDLPRIELFYEDDLASADAQLAAVDRVFTAVGLEPHVPKSSLVPIAPASARDRVRNYDELAATLATTRFRAFLDQ